MKTIKDKQLLMAADFAGYPLKEAIKEYLEKKGWTVNFSNYDMLTQKFGKASDCIACGQCEGACPQHLTIIDYLKDVAAHYEGA